MSRTPSYKARGTIAAVEKPPAGAVEDASAATSVQRTPAPPVQPAPTLGADTDDVLREIAGLSAEQIAEAREPGPT